MAKLALKLSSKSIGKNRYGEDAHDYYVGVYNLDTKQPVEIDYCDGINHNFITKIQKPEGLSGLVLLNKNNETKLIIKFLMSSHIYEIKSESFPYTIKDGEVVSRIPLREIIKYSKKIEIFNAEGLFICKEDRFKHDVRGVKDFDIKFNKNDFTIVDMFVPNYKDYYNVTKRIIDYSGKTLVNQTKEMHCDNVIKNNLNEDEEIIL